MPRLHIHPESHLVSRTGWLRAAVLVAGPVGRIACFSALFGAVGARAGGANVMSATLWVTFWGALAKVLTAGAGAVPGTVVE